MKMTQAWGWLVAAVLAAGLNASYHNGGLEWAHQIADRVEQGSAAVLAQASGHAGQFLTEARLLTARTETASCPFATTLTQVQTRIARSSETSVERFDVMSAREERQLARLEANRARMEAQIARQTAHIRIATAAFAPIARSSETSVERFDVMSAREERQLARLEANRARMEAQIARQTAHIRIATAALDRKSPR